MWLAIAGSVVICGVIVKVIESLGTYVKHFHLSNGKSSQKLSISESIWLMFASYVKQGEWKLSAYTITQAITKPDHKMIDLKWTSWQAVIAAKDS